MPALEGVRGASEIEDGLLATLTPPAGGRQARNDRDGFWNLGERRGLVVTVLKFGHYMGLAERVVFFSATARIPVRARSMAGRSTFQ
jgi:hypothetical protein